MKILVTGGAGYIGSHTSVELLKAGHDVVVYDNLCNASEGVFARIEQITGKKPVFVRGDVRDSQAVEKALRDHSCSAIIHFAGLKAVGESVEKPLSYYDNNVMGTMRVLEAAEKAGVRQFVFSSSATVYGAPQFLPFTEAHPTAAMNPYGKTKLAAEGMIEDFAIAFPSCKVALLRYFNPVGAHESGLIGEEPKGIPNNLMPYVTQVAAGRREFLNVWGNDYETPDGTGVRDYVHVVDLAIGHVRALEYMAKNNESLTINLGTGQGHSVMDMIKAFEKASGKKVAYKIGPRRSGDLPAYWADPSLAQKLLGWQAERDLEAMCRDSWNWQSKNPDGYA